MKPILFNTEMVKKILLNQKTVTRRPVKPQPPIRPALKMCTDDIWRLEWWDLNTFHSIKVPYCIGDILYVRETWQYAYDFDGNERAIEGTGRYLYAADENNPSYDYWIMPDGTYRDSMPWRPSIHMPREAARIFLRVTDVRAEQLYCITGKQARAEGFLSRDAFIRAFLTMYPDCTVKSWVLVIEFERISKEEAYANE